ncbi:MAG: DUF1902 domain-containing protein [Proteobacteria bacterium]|nr:DUF1902 domain-containing protein [Pseudomonadota bacterium]
MKVQVHAEWDDEAGVWVATSDDVPGLVTEADTVEALVTKLRELVPDLMEANGVEDGRDVPVELLSHCTLIAHRHCA